MNGKNNYPSIVVLPKYITHRFVVDYKNVYLNRR